MSAWIDRILTEFTADLARLWIAADPTADNTIPLPDATGYVALTTGGPPASTRIPFGHTDGTLATDSTFTYNTGTDTLAVANLTLGTGGALGFREC